jgi:hypothetical protein
MKTLSQFQSEFETGLENSNNKKFTLENEVKEVLNYINTIPTYTKLFRKPIKPTFENKANKIFVINIPVSLRSLFSEAFTKYITTGDYELERLYHDTNETYQIKDDTVKQAYVFSEYYKWLNELITRPQKVEKKSSLTHKQKLLALHYLGLDTSKFENSKTAKILSEILELSEDNTRQYLSYITAGKNEVRTKANLEKVNQLFENQGLSDISSNIKKDLEKL